VAKLARIVYDYATMEHAQRGRRIEPVVATIAEVR
jgi:hypothetical protein